MAKVVVWTISLVVILLLVLAYVIQIPSVQNRIVQKIVNSIKGTIGTNVSLGAVKISFPKTIVIENFYVEDQHRDTLVSVGHLSANADLWQLIRKRIELDGIKIKNLRGYVTRSEQDSAYNFDFIVNAFSEKDTSQVKDSTASWNFALEKVDIQNANVKFYDSLDGNFISGQWKDLQVNMDEFDLSKSIVKFDRVLVSQLVTRVVQTKEEVPTDEAKKNSETNKTPFDFGINQLQLNNIDAKYERTVTGEHVNLNLGKLEMTSDDIDLKQQIVNITNLNIENSFFSYQTAMLSSNLTKASQDSTSSTNEKPLKSQIPWDIRLRELTVANVGLQYYDFTKPMRQDAIDYNHAWISQLNIDMHNVHSKGSNIQADISNVSFFEKSGFSLTSFQTQLKLTERNLSLKDFLVTTANSKLNLDGSMSFDSFETLAKEYSKANVSLNIDESVLTVRDLLYFNPHIMDSLPILVSSNDRLAFHGKVQGKVSKLSVEDLEAKAFGSTLLQLHGTVDGLPQTSNMNMNIVVDKFYTTNVDVQRVLTDSLLPSNITLPEWITLKGKYNGTILAGKVNSLVTSNRGNIAMKADLNFDTTSVRQGYSGEVTLDSVNLDHLLNSKGEIGKLSLVAKANGTGWKRDNFKSHIDLTLQSLEYKKYVYRDVKMKGTMKNFFFDGSLSSTDKNLDFNIVGDFDYSKDVPRYHLTADLRNVDFDALHLSQGILKARGKLSVDVVTNDFRTVNGDISINNVAIFNGKSLYKVDSLLFASISQEGQTNISLKSDFISGDFKGTMNLFDLPLALKHHFNSYFLLHDSTLTANAKPQNFSFTLKIKKTELLTDILLPKLKSFRPGVIKGDFNSLEKKLDVSVNVRRIVYDGVRIDSGSLKIQSDKQALNYRLAVNNFRDQFVEIPTLLWTGSVASDSLKTRLVILDSLAKEKYILGGVFYSVEKKFKFHFLKGQTILNYDAWHIPADNYVLFNAKKIEAHNLVLTNNNQQLSVKTLAAKDSSVSVGFRKFSIAYLASLISGSKTLMEGTLDGDVHFLKNGGMDALIKLNSLVILKEPWGNLSLNANHASAGKTSLNLTMKGDNGNLTAQGYYQPKSDANKNELNVTMSISKFHLQLVEPLTFGKIKDLTGVMNGDISLSGSIEKPQLRGKVNFIDAELTPSYLNSKFLLKNETIQFMEDGIHFNNFQIRDGSNNTAKFNGVARTADFTNYKFNIDIVAKNFQLLNTTEDQSDLFYGKVHINTKANLTGTSDQPVVVMDLSLTEGSTFTYIVPQSDKGVLEQKGIVEFVDRDAVKDPFLANIKVTDTIQNTFVGIDLTANIQLSPKVVFTIVIDPATGDKLTVQGDGTLSYKMDPTGDTQLTGRYEISKGTYNLSFYKLVKREFVIDNGSTITWFGDPLNARMDIRAIYNVETSPLELLASQLNSANTTEINQYKQRLPFQVFLNIDGELLSPEIKFQLGMPLEKRNAFGGNVYARIQDINTRESDLNRQVFSLLLLRRFMADNPLDNQGASSMQANARRSVSRLLTEQLNQLSGNIKGVDLNFDLKSDESYSTGEARGNTKLQVGVSRKLFNDRLVVKVAGNVNIEGETSSQSAFTDYLGDLALEYKVTEDGRLRATGFRNSNYDMIDGELIQTGVGLIYIKEYNFLRELFKANAENN